ncbi:hypothetical protein D3C87_2197380 [compost metagenome]
MGRTIFAEAADRWFAGQISDAQVIDDIASRYARLVVLWDEARAGMSESVSAIF